MRATIGRREFMAAMGGRQLKLREQTMPDLVIVGRLFGSLCQGTTISSTRLATPSYRQSGSRISGDKGQPDDRGLSPCLIEKVIKCG